MRPMTASRARRTAVLTGALATMIPLAVQPATAQTPDGAGAAPAPTATAAAAAPAKAKTTLKVRHARKSVTAGRSLLVRGTLTPARAGRTVVLRAQKGGRWVTVDADKTSKGGAYRLSARMARPGTMNARVVFTGDRTGLQSRRSLGRVHVFRRAFASWYGPGLYGNKLGCGGRLYPGTVGVAHKTLPCGTKLTLRHGSRTVRTSVIDRGPYVGGREFDLTQATKQRLGFGSTGYVLSTR